MVAGKGLEQPWCKSTSPEVQWAKEGGGGGPGVSVTVTVLHHALKRAQPHPVLRQRDGQTVEEERGVF